MVEIANYSIPTEPPLLSYLCWECSLDFMTGTRESLYVDYQYIGCTLHYRRSISRTFQIASEVVRGDRVVPSHTLPNNIVIQLVAIQCMFQILFFAEF